MMKYPFSGCLKDKAFKTEESQKRKSEDDGDKVFFDICDPFLLDSSKITESKVFRRLANKTQVFCFPDNPHVRNRMTHTLGVTPMGVLMANTLGLNVYLVMACSFAHDVGHVPFGHIGEKFLSNYMKISFQHSLFGPIILEEIEREGRGLNLKEETLSGIRVHSGANFEEDLKTEEFKVLRLADKISYTFSDPNDAIRFKYLSASELPRCFKLLGSNQRERVNTCLLALFNESLENETVSFSKSDVAKLYLEARGWLFENIYPRANTRVINEELSLAFEAILGYSEFADYDPVVIFSTLTENGIREIAQRGLSKERVDYLGINEIISSLERGKRYYNDNNSKKEELQCLLK